MDNTLLAVVIGGFLAGIPTIIIGIMNNRNARRIIYDENAFNIAVKAWESHCKMADGLAESGYRVTVGDVQSYVLYSVLVMDAASKGKMSKKHARKSLEDIHDVMEVIDEFASKRISGEIKTTNKSRHATAASRPV